MTLWVEIVLALLIGPLLWMTGAVLFDAVHGLLHAMLRSRFRLLRTLAWPHQVHHHWIGPDRQVRTDLELLNIDRCVGPMRMRPASSRSPRTLRVRILLAPKVIPRDAEEPRRGAERALRWLRRGLHHAPMAPGLRGLQSDLAFRATRPAPQARRVRHRREWAEVGG